MSLRNLTLKKKIALLMTSAVLAIGLTTWMLLFHAEKRDAIKYTESLLTRNLDIMAEAGEKDGISGVNQIAQVWSRLFPDGRITVISLNGDVISDSKVNPGQMENHYTRREVIEAFASGAASEMRYSKTQREWQIYMARRVIVPGTPGDAYVIRASYPIAKLSGLVKNVSVPFIKYFSLILILVWLVAYLLLKIILKPMHALSEAALCITKGKRARFPLTGDCETQTLSNTLNEMQDALFSTIAEAKERKEELSQLVGALPIGVVLFDDEKKIRYINEEAARICGLSAVPARGSSVELALPSHELCGMLDEKDQRRRINIPGAGIFCIEATTRSLPRGRMIVLLDLTEKARLEELKKDFFIDAGHEFQTPLAIIRAGLELMKSEPQMSAPERAEDLDTINSLIQQQERISGLVDDLLLLVRLDSEPEAKSPERIKAAEMAEEIIDDLSVLPSDKEVVMTIVQKSPDAEISGSLSELRRAFLNIIDNARKYTQFTESQRGEVKITIEEDGAHIKITVDDNGPGVPEADRRMIFERFHRGDAHRARGGKKSGGYGLGLSISRRIIERSHGTLTLGVSELGGAAFVIRLPK
ncbi:MAG: PAS domain-containing sensor histidine kinase [Cloacibacillus sp.]